MRNFKKLKNNKRIFVRLIGISRENFDFLVKKISKKVKNKKRGRNYKLKIEELLFLQLLYYRSYVSYIFLGMLGDLDSSNICRNFNRISVMVSEILDIKSLKIVKTNLSEEEILELILDATEQESEKRKGSKYSGKKKRNTVKTQIIVTKNGKVKHVSSTVSGNIHDKKLFDNSRIKIPKTCNLIGDLGYVGTDCIIPKKNSKLQKLSKDDKIYNKQHSKRRIIVEHVFAHLKKWGILRDRFRNNISHYNTIFFHIVAIYNLKFNI